MRRKMIDHHSMRLQQRWALKNENDKLNGAWNMFQKTSHYNLEREGNLTSCRHFLSNGITITLSVRSWTIQKYKQHNAKVPRIEKKKNNSALLQIVIGWQTAKTPSTWWVMLISIGVNKVTYQTDPWPGHWQHGAQLIGHQRVLWCPELRSNRQKWLKKFHFFDKFLFFLKAPFQSIYNICRP